MRSGALASRRSRSRATATWTIRPLCGPGLVTAISRLPHRPHAPHGLPAAASFPNTCRCNADADADEPHTSAGSLSLAAVHWAHSVSVLPATLIPELARYQESNLASVAAVMTMLPFRSQLGGPEKIESERPRVPWLSMHSTSSAGASELRNCPAWLLVGAGIGGGPDEHAVTAQPRRITAAAQMPGCFICRTYGSLECDRLYYRDGQRRDPVRDERRGKSSHRRRARKTPALDICHLGVVFPEMS